MNEPKLKILVASPTPTHPISGGNRARIYRLVRELNNAGHEVHFAHASVETGDDQAMAQAWGDRYHQIPYQSPSQTIRRVVKKLQRFLELNAQYNRPVDALWDNATGIALQKLHEAHQFDVVIVEYVFFSKAFAAFPAGVRKILDTHDVFTNRYRLYLQNNARPQWFSTSARQEALALNRADVALAIQEKEAGHFRSISATPVKVVGHFVEIRQLDSPDQNLDLTYIGAKNPINVQSMDWFRDEVLPLVKQAHPNVRVGVAGSICDVLERDPNMIFLGETQDLPATYARSRIVINPMLYGTGLKIKTIEALGFGKPLVTTPCGAEGLENGCGTAFLVADKAPEMADHLIRVLSDGELRDELGSRATACAQRWNAVALKNLTDALSA